MYMYVYTVMLHSVPTSISDGASVCTICGLFISMYTVCVKYYVTGWSSLPTCRFWSLLDMYCPSGQPYSLPIVSSFGRGCGDMVCVDGTLVHQGHWSNLGAQDLQPSFISSMLRNNAKV